MAAADPITRNKQAMLAMTQAFNVRKAEVAPDLLHPDQFEDKAFPDFPLQPELADLPTHERIAAEVQLVHDAFENAKYTVKDLVADETHAVLIWEFTGTHKGEFFGRGGTGTRVNVIGYEFVEFKDGKMYRHYDNHNQTTIEVLAQCNLLDDETMRAMSLRR